MNGSPLVWITGATGLIGSELVRSAPRIAPNFLARGLSRADVDLLDTETLSRLFRNEKPHAIIHCAAMAQSGQCDANPDAANRINVELTRFLAELAAEIPFIFFSTDLVFDGEKGNYVEEDAARPLSVYGTTKAKAEDEVRRHTQHLILRLSLTGGHSSSGNRGFNEEIKNAWSSGKALNLFVDEHRCPSSSDVISRAVWELFLKGARGTFHLCGSERLSRYEIGQSLATKHPELNPRINATSRKDYKGPPRPRDTSMNCAKAQRLLSFEIPRFSAWLAQDCTGF